MPISEKGQKNCQQFDWGRNLKTKAEGMGKKPPKNTVLLIAM